MGEKLPDVYVYEINLAIYSIESHSKLLSVSKW